MNKIVFAAMLVLAQLAGTIFSAAAVRSTSADMMRHRPARVAASALTPQIVRSADAGVTRRQYAPTRAGDCLVNFTLADSVNYEISLAVGINAETGVCYYYAESDDWGVPQQIPQGTYNFLFRGEKAEDPYDYVMYAMDNVSLTDDYKAEIDFSKCTELVSFRSSLPDGTRACMPLENSDTGEVIEAGTLSFGMWNLYVMLGNILIDTKYGYMERGTFDDGWSYDSEAGGNVYVNPDQKSLSLVQYRMMAGDESRKVMMR